MELLGLFVGFLALLLLVGLPLLALVAWIRLRDLGRRVEFLEAREREWRVSEPPPTPARPIAPLAPRPEPVVVERVVPPAPAGPWSSEAVRPAGAQGAPVPPPASPPTPTPTPAPAAARAAPSPARAPGIDWERWLGVRGAAVVGGIFLAVAGILFFQYSIERGWITPLLRVITGALFGLAALAGGLVVRKRGYEITGNAISGAGAVILYAAIWAASPALFGFLPMLVAFAGMAAVTATTCWLAWRNGSQLVAWLGLTGGFATPLLLSTGQDNPVGLFSYLLLLDLGFLFLANQRRWPLLGSFGLLGTLVLFALYVFERMAAASFPIALLALGLFALLFVLFVPRASGHERLRWMASQVGALLFPFVFAIYFAQRVDLGFHVWPLMALCALLVAAASWLARKQEAVWVPLGAAAGTSAMALAWVLGERSLGGSQVWELAACVIAVGLVFLFFCEWRRAAAGKAALGSDTAALAFLGGAAVALTIAGTGLESAGPWPHLAGLGVLGLLAARVGALAGWNATSAIAFPLVAVALVFRLLVESDRWMESYTRLALLLVFLALPLAFALASFARRSAPGRRRSFLGVALALLAGHALAAEVTRGGVDDALLHDGAFAVLSLLVVLAASAARSVVPIALAVLACLGSVGHETTASSALAALPFAERGEHLLAIDRWQLGLAFALVALFAGFPLASRRAWEGRRWPWRIAALSTLLLAIGAKDCFEAVFGAAHKAWFPALLGVVPLACAWFASRGEAPLAATPPAARSPRQLGTILQLAVLCVLVALVPPLASERAELTWFLTGTALLLALLWRRVDHAPLKYLALVGAVAGALVGPAEDVLGSLERPERVLWNAFGWSYLLPALLVLATAFVLRAREVARLRESERRLYGRELAVCGATAGAFGLALLFVWLNVEVQSRFANGGRFQLDFGGFKERDTWVSIAWAAYALALLAVGMWKRMNLLRWASLVLLIVTIGKLFLIDLQGLEGLYRVASFLGLAVSLLLVSFSYQRFVFRSRPAS